jgi:threonine dehydratase
MPENSPTIKIDGVKRNGGIVYIYPVTEEARYTLCLVIQAETGAVLIHPLTDQRIIAGQGTLGLELLGQLSSLKTVVAPIGGCGLISGLAIALKESNPSIRLIGVEPEGANDTNLPLLRGRREPLPGGGKSIAEGLLSTVGPINFGTIQ